MIYNMTTPNDKIGFAEVEALKRRERLLKLKKQVEKRQNGDDSEEQGSQSPSNVSDTGSQNDITETAEAEVEQPTIKSSILDEELDLNQLAPRKIDWDLKRDIERKLEILQERTSTAIAELVRDDMVDDI